MPSEPSGRPLLPQTAQMQSFAFAPPTLAPRENQRNYVFVDEHNRHKRLKVMRACEGCRRRKIKCDAATTNAWPCAACIRLKLNCVPPTVSYDKDYNAATQTYELDTKPLEYATGPDPQHDFQRPAPMPTSHAMSHHIPASMPASMPPSATGAYADGMRMYQNAPYADQHSHDAIPYGTMPPVVPQPNINYAPQIYSEPPPPPSTMTMTPPESEGQWKQDPTSNLADALGELQIDLKGVAPWITSQRKQLAETPALEDFEIQLPPTTTLDSTVRIPPEMMPTEEQALAYFEYYFENVHPYFPVINKTYFYQQWQSARDSMSPLMLEAIFACASLMLGEDTEGHRWLALASKHEESFKDVPRLSTMQAMLLLLKAREAMPKRGYFWRSWMTVVNLVAMGKGLELDEHYENHQMGKPCGTSVHECITRTRVWQMLFILETMVGGPQGRTTFQVEPSSIDYTLPRPVNGPDVYEAQISRQFTQYVRALRNVHNTTVLCAKLRKKTPDWALDPTFVGLNADYPMWLNELPEEMQISYPADGSVPWIPSHFIANMHCYHHLGVIMHLRPQINAIADPYDPTWKQHMLTSYCAAKQMCKLQEAVLKMYGLPGLLCMIRGISFTVYAVLTCTMLHLVAITCPDPDLNSDAREFFVRHMRILEECTPSWPMPEMQQQVNNLRQAFSADVTKPFELKPSFPFGSPQVHSQSSPPSNPGSFRSRLPSQASPLDQPGQVNYHAHPISPPISASDHDTTADSPVAQSLVMMASGQRAPQPTTGMHIQEAPQWNPQRIFDQWNVAFGTPPPSSASQSSPPLRPPPTGSNNYELRTPQDTTQPNYQMPNMSPQSSGLSGGLPGAPPASTYAPAAAPYITPTMWQEVVASSFQDGLKRRWDHGAAPMDQSMYKRAR